nr:MAG TPA: hypothetical protein [Caudoviricetes sp.]
MLFLLPGGGEFGHSQRTISHISRHYGKNEL